MKIHQTLDKFTLLLFAVVLLAMVLPVQGSFLSVMSWATNIAIAALFFMHGAKLSSREVFLGLTHWRLHTFILSGTFLFFPIIGLIFKPLFRPLLGEDLYLGVLYMCALPATVQSAIAFTSLARGNVAAAICSATISSLLGIFITPLMVLILIGPAASGADISLFEAMQKIVIQLLIPFLLGQMSRPWFGKWVDQNRSWLKNVDQGSIILVVFTAFAQSANEGLWKKVSGSQLFVLFAVCSLFLLIAMTGIWWLSGVFKFRQTDRIAILFGGSKKSLATGVPMAQILFSDAGVGLMILPIMIFHQLQLIISSVLAKRFSKRFK